MTQIIKQCMAVAAGLMAVLSGCSATPAPNNDKTENMNVSRKSKAVVVFFSHAGENYSVGRVAVGNTALVAREIQRVTGADLFEIVPVKSYDMPYDALTKLAKEESARGEKPAFKGGIEDMAQYDTVFIGGPIWWGTYPRVMFTFFDAYDLNGKTIIPFSTHEGSGLGSVVDDLRRLYPKATIGQPLAIYGHQARKDLRPVDSWLRQLGY